MKTKKVYKNVKKIICTKLDVKTMSELFDKHGFKITRSGDMMFMKTKTSGMINDQKVLKLYNILDSTKFELADVRQTFFNPHYFELEFVNF